MLTRLVKPVCQGQIEGYWGIGKHSDSEIGWSRKKKATAVWKWKPENERLVLCVRSWKNIQVHINRNLEKWNSNMANVEKMEHLDTDRQVLYSMGHLL